MKYAMHQQMLIKTAHIRKILARFAILGFGLSVASCVSLGADPPPQLLTLTSVQQPQAGVVIETNAADAIIVQAPIAARAIDTARIPVHINDTAIAYIESAFWSDKPARLFGNILAETITAQTGQLVLSQPEPGEQRGVMLSGHLLTFGYDEGLGAVVVRYDAMIRVPGGPVRKRRFEAEEPVFDIKPQPVGRALNIAANKVANDVAKWVQQ